MSQASWAISLRLTKRMNLSPIAMEKRREEYVERSASAAAGVWGAGSHSSANTYSQETVKHSIPCLATTVTYRPNCQIDQPGHRDTATRRSCFQHSPLLFRQFSGNLRSTQNTCTIITFDSQTGGKGTLGPSWSTLIPNYLLTRKSGTWSSPESTMAWEYLFVCSTPTEHP